MRDTAVSEAGAERTTSTVRRMYRMLVMFPAAADPSLIDSLVVRAAAALRQLMGFQAVTTSVDALMGPSARSGDFSHVMEADFATVDDALAALHDEAFQGVRAAIESLGPMLLLYEVAEV